MEKTALYTVRHKAIIRSFPSSAGRSAALAPCCKGTVCCGFPCRKPGQDLLAGGKVLTRHRIKGRCLLIE